MTVPLTIAAEAPGLQQRLSKTLATLPVSFRMQTEEASPTAMLIAGEGDWPTRGVAAIDAGARAVIIADPGMTDANAVLALADRAEQAGAVVELAERYAGDPSLLRHRADLIEHLAATSTILISQISDFATPAHAALEMVRTLRALGQPLILTHLWRTPHAVMVRGRAREKLFEGIATAGSAGTGQRIDALGFGRTLRLALRGDGSAVPSDLRLANAKGERKLAQVFESVDRAAWQRVLTAIRSGRADGSALREFADDLLMIEAL
ncbi:hypothetical protein BV98_000074 [Sphingobium herbicidovorans NBRC 16415]|uniref:Uncharacterized protein n=1 Tax=Sphingobium herbicidovorans (strain ATCC 700291 / DSM 11019 / CCUG 56400 / KCTC 2939 / LMG 18315 / NBRC 16415 / MH) TaxID=1219045 RepID=A0A086PEK8_SPHHM|nr:hypothetical protein [Sphingobium herbicidovorans]KFG91826.1 hypothetical protein BV98_000074 [Sphingobium herbicidovorans NBRC 16415]